MFVEFPKCRMHYATSRDPNRPALNVVYLDLQKQLMFAADGCSIAIKRIHVTEGTEDLGETLIGIPSPAMAWLMGARGKDVRLLLLRAGDHVLVSHGDRQTVAITGTDLSLKAVNGMQEVAGEIVARENAEGIVCVDLRKFRQAHMATGETYAAIGMSAKDTDVSKGPYVIANKDAVSIVMPVHMEGKKQLDVGIELLREFALGPEEQEEGEDDGTVQDA